MIAHVKFRPQPLFMHRILRSNEKSCAEMTVARGRRVGSAISRGYSESRARRKEVNDYRCRRIVCARAETARADIAPIRRPSFDMRWLLETPPLYTVTLAIVAGDALGNCGVFLPLWIGIALAVSATVLFMASCPTLATAIALAGISAAATVPVHQLLYPRNNPAAITRFADNSMVTVEGRLVREPEAVGIDRAYLMHA